MVKKPKRRIQDGFDLERLFYVSLCGIGVGVVLHTDIDLDRIAERTAIIAGIVATARSIAIPAAKRSYDEDD